MQNNLLFKVLTLIIHDRMIAMLMATAVVYTQCLSAVLMSVVRSQTMRRVAQWHWYGNTIFVGVPFNIGYLISPINHVYLYL